MEILGANRKHQDRDARAGIRRFVRAELRRSPPHLQDRRREPRHFRAAMRHFRFVAVITTRAATMPKPGERVFDEDARIFTSSTSVRARLCGRFGDERAVEVVLPELAAVVSGRDLDDT